MLVINEVNKLRSLREDLLKKNKTVGFVPTMGALHKGHISLIKQSHKENDKTIVSIFVNPAQFNQKSDFETYPRILDDDIAKLKNEGVDLLFAPDEKEIYPEKAEIEMNIPSMTHHLCGSTRPGHFNGVLLVVSKLFNMVSPNRAYFGKKDYQQLAIIRKMTKDLSFCTEIIGCEIIREDSGLAMSSRNTLLSKEEKVTSAEIFQALKASVNLYEKGEKTVKYIKEKCREHLLKAGINKVDYIEVCDKITLQKIGFANDDSIILTAVFVGKVRLIDNLEFSVSCKK